MTDLDDILKEAAERQAQSVRAAFEAGRVAGRREAADELRYKLGMVLAAESGSPRSLFDRPDARVEPIEAATVTAEAGGAEQRAAPGSVKPTIAQLVNERPGLTVDEVTTITGFKKNSVRGTLWLLGTEGQVERRGRQWFPRAQKDEAAGANPEERTPTASNTGPFVKDERTSDQSTHGGPEAVEGQVAHEKMNIFS